MQGTLAGCFGRSARRTLPRVRITMIGWSTMTGNAPSTIMDRTSSSALPEVRGPEAESSSRTFNWTSRNRIAERHARGAGPAPAGGRPLSSAPSRSACRAGSGQSVCRAAVAGGVRRTRLERRQRARQREITTVNLPTLLPGVKVRLTHAVPAGPCARRLAMRGPLALQIWERSSSKSMSRTHRRRPSADQIRGSTTCHGS
jgi:hypothetical protein